MKKCVLMLTALLFSVVMVMGQQVGDDFTGKWKTEDGHVIIISKTNGKFTGLDDKNRESLYNMRFEDGKWKGTVENHDEGKKADCEAYLQGNKLKIVAHKSFFSKTFIWIKVQ